MEEVEQKVATAEMLWKDTEKYTLHISCQALYCSSAAAEVRLLVQLGASTTLEGKWGPSAPRRPTSPTVVAAHTLYYHCITPKSL